MTVTLKGKVILLLVTFAFFLSLPTTLSRVFSSSRQKQDQMNKAVNELNARRIFLSRNSFELLIENSLTHKKSKFCGLTSCADKLRIKLLSLTWPVWTASLSLIYSLVVNIMLCKNCIGQQWRYKSVRPYTITFHSQNLYTTTNLTLWIYAKNNCNLLLFIRRLWSYK